MANNLPKYRPLVAGDLIYDIKPILHVVYDEFRGKNCDNCLNKCVTPLRCSKCRQMYYCDTNCLQNDNKYHSNECEVFRQKSFKANEIQWSERLLLRFWLIFKIDETFVTKKYKLYYGSEISLKGMNFNDKGFSQQKDRMNDFRHICSHFKDYGLKFDVEELRHWFGKLTASPMNSQLFSYCPEERNVGCGVFPELVSVHHSCFPNSADVTNGLSLQLRAIKPIGIGAQITRNYINGMEMKNMRNTRQSTLNKVFLFDCNCIQCEYNVDSYMNSKYFRLLIEKKEMLFNKIANFKGKVVNPSVHHLDCVKEFIDVVIQLEEVFHKMYGEYHPIVIDNMVTEIRHREMLAKMTQTDVEYGFYQRLEKCSRVAYGENHPFYHQINSK